MPQYGFYWEEDPQRLTEQSDVIEDHFVPVSPLYGICGKTQHKLSARLPHTCFSDLGSIFDIFIFGTASCSQHGAYVRAWKGKLELE